MLGYNVFLKTQQKNYFYIWFQHKGRGNVLLWRRGEQSKFVRACIQEGQWKQEIAFKISSVSLKNQYLLYC